MTALTILPKSIVSIEGDVFLTENPKSLVEDCLLKKKMGVIKGDIYLVGGSMTPLDNGGIEYSEKIKLFR